MIKAPITKTGDIKYFELIKIFVLVSFFYAFSSFLTDQSSLVLGTQSILVLNLINILVTFVVLFVSYGDVVELIEIIKSFAIKLIIMPVIEVKEVIVNTVSSFTEYISNKTFLSLCVIRC